MSERAPATEDQQIRATPEQTDSERKRFGYGPGGVPWFLLALYIAFLVVFTWYVLDNQLPDFLLQGPGQGGEPPMTSTQ